MLSKGYIYALAFFVLGFVCTLCLKGGEQFTLALVSFMSSAAIAFATTMLQHDNEGKR